MKYCTHCGAEIMDDAVICVHCGCKVESKSAAATATSSSNSVLATIVKIFMILSTISLGFLLIPLAWCIPMTVSVFGKLDRKETIGTGMKVCVLLFVDKIAGICLLCMNDN